MSRANHFIKRYLIVWYMGLLLIAATYLTFNVTRPLKDYDEATYAKVIVDSFKSGDVSTFTLSGHPWFEKPPLYIWEAMGAVKIFGDGGFAFRLPSIIASTLCIWLVYLITKRLTGNDLAALSASLVVLTVAPFYVFAIEMRMDSSVIMGMLAALYFFIRGWIDERYLLAVAPAIAIGFMFKSVIVFLIGPILLLYAIFYSEWRWIRSRYLWLGTLIALGIWLPWHALETLRFGSTFWNEYLGHQILQRASSTLTGTNSYADIPRWLFVDASYWSFIVVGLIGLSLILSVWKKTSGIINWKQILPPIISALFIFLVFTMVRTHLPTYMMPAFPFLAMFIGIFLSQLSALFRRYSYVASIVIFPLITAPLVVIGAVQSFSPTFKSVLPVVYEEQTIGQLYKSHNNNGAPIYSLDWPQLETLNYYGNTSTQFIKPEPGTILKGPFYLIIAGPLGDYFAYSDNGTIKSRYPQMSFLYTGKSLGLMYSDQDIRLPTLDYSLMPY